jgi:tetratricopeptide (TPR) repeat protein
MYKKLLFCLLLGITLLISCQTGKPIKRLSNEGMIYAMIYDYDNTSVSGAAVYINGKKTADSDIQGRFILDKMKNGRYRIKLIKRGYETLEEFFQYDPMQVLYFKMINASQLAVLAEKSLDNAEFAAAENYINRALLIEPNRPDILFLKSIACYLQARNEEAVEILENLIKAGSNEPSISQLLEKIRQTKLSEE